MKLLIKDSKGLGQPDRAPDSIAAGAELVQELALAGIPAYLLQANACRALDRFIKYHQFQSANGDSN